MVEELLKNVRRTASGRKVLASPQKAALVEDWGVSGLSCPEYCRRHGLIASQLYKWRSDAKTGAIMGIRNEGGLHTKTGLEMLRKQNGELKKALGEATLGYQGTKKSWNGTHNETGS